MTRWEDLYDELYDADDPAEFEPLKTRLLIDLKAHRLAQACKSRCLTQRDVAEAMGLSVGRVSQPIFPQAELAEDRRSTQRHDVALRMEKAIGQLAVEDFVTPPPAAFAKGRSELTFAAYAPWRPR